MMVLLRALLGWLGIGYVEEMLRRRKLAAPSARDRVMMRLEIAVVGLAVVFVMSMLVGSAPRLVGLGKRGAVIAWYVCGLCAFVILACSVMLGILDSRAARGIPAGGSGDREAGTDSAS